MKDKRLRGLSGTALKLVALVTMLIDHIGAAIISPMVRQYSWSFNRPESFFHTGDPLTIVYFFLRIIGRLSFPIFCFFIVEGFVYTKNRYRYGFLLLVFAIISEIPFDLAIRHRVMDLRNQNVFWTLFIAYIGICAIDAIRVWMKAKPIGIMLFNNMTKYICMVCLEVIIICISIALGLVLRVDYTEEGILCIIVMYLTMLFTSGGAFKERSPKSNVAMMAAGVVVLGAFSYIELVAVLLIPLMYFYNGTRGKGLKYFFYAFYPLHLLCCYIVSLGL